jgi:hypothetical protein
MLSAYYGRCFDSYQMFANLVVAKEPSFKEHLNNLRVKSSMC